MSLFKRFTQTLLYLQVNKTNLQKLLAALNECSEWGQIYILDYLATYMPSSDREAESVVERITPRLQHANSAVALSATKVILKYLPLLDAGEAAAGKSVTI